MVANQEQIISTEALDRTEMYNPSNYGPLVVTAAVAASVACEYARFMPLSNSVQENESAE